MKSTLLALLLSLSVFEGYAQKNTIIGLFGGGGIATANNYDVALSGGLDYAKGVSVRSLIGVEVLYQQFSLLYDNEANGARHATGIAGEITRHTSAYVFLAPKFRYCAGRHQNIHFYANAGIGMNMGGYDSVRKFNTISTPNGFVRTDTTFDMSENINSTVFRIGVGCTQYLVLGPHWRFTVTEDVGFIPASLSTTSDYSDATRSIYSPNRINPTYVSIRLGISYTRFN